MSRKLKKSFCCILAGALMLIMGSGVCFANDGMPVLQFDHDSYIGSPNSTITVGATVTDPDNSKPMKGVKVTFTLKDKSGTSTPLDTQTSGADGTVTCDVPLGDAFPYTLTGSASDGVNLTSITIKASSEESTKATAATEEAVELPDVEVSDGSEDVEKAETKSMLSGISLLLITLITVVIIAVIVIIIVVTKSKKKKNNNNNNNNNKE